MKNLKIYFLALLFCCFFSAEAASKSYNLTSPDGKISVEIETEENLSYLVRYEGNIVVDKSEIAMTLADGTGAGKEFLGWMNLPASKATAETRHIQAAAENEFNGYFHNINYGHIAQTNKFGGTYYDTQTLSR